MARSILRLPLQTQTSPGAACGDGTASGPAFGRQRSLGVLVRLPCPEVAAWSVSRQPGAASDKVAGRPSTRRPGAPGALQTHVVQRVRPLPPSSRLPCRWCPGEGPLRPPGRLCWGSASWEASQASWSCGPTACGCPWVACGCTGSRQGLGLWRTVLLPSLCLQNHPPSLGIARVCVSSPEGGLGPGLACGLRRGVGLWCLWGQQPGQGREAAGAAETTLGGRSFPQGGH